MPVNGYTVGRDVTVTMIDRQNGVAGRSGRLVIDSANVVSFDAKALKKEDWARPLNSPPMPLYIPDGWRGTLEIDRTDNTADLYQQNIEDRFWNGGNTTSGSIQELINEPDGSKTVKQYTQAMFWVEDTGTYRADGKVVQRIEWSAGRCRTTMQAG